MRAARLSCDLYPVNVLTLFELPPSDKGDQLRNKVQVVFLKEEDLLDHFRVHALGQLESEVK